MLLSQVAAITNGQLMGSDGNVISVNIDTRTLAQGDLYIAIVGESKNGHAYISQAITAGAAAILSDRTLDVQIPYVKVADTTTALQQLAVAQRDVCDVKTIAVTGSCGKTTTRAFLQAVFAQKGNTHASVGSFNNHIGVPLTLLALKNEHEFLISEVGTNAMGEIAPLTMMIKPDVAMITNVGPGHLEGFGSLQNIAEEKGTIFSGLSQGGTAIINSDDRFASYWRPLNQAHRILTFGIKHDADVMADNIIMDAHGYASFTLVLPETYVDVTLATLGMHNVANALAAAAAGYALGLTALQIKAGLEATVAEKHRLVKTVLPSGAILIDDSYNANPLSTEAALSLLAQKASASVLVFGDMKELGDNALALHADIGEKAKQLGLAHLYCYGDLTKQTADAFGEGAYHFDDKNRLIDQLKNELNPGQTILVKGSRSMKMEEVVAGLLSVE
ncbi:MAG: UDP-N-acetylmuramoyl-tripeptide--D-alanyl-D-alanine ligase [Coxiella sp. (in: Bacteria)]|nr:MAG: UDP-N-acetylmuramoyl-tripeptide--D-alanyl-D-alanine ligase [Coxiella sp. (in: g-proteobacteria)]